MDDRPAFDPVLLNHCQDSTPTEAIGIQNNTPNRRGPRAHRPTVEHFISAEFHFMLLYCPQNLVGKIFSTFH